MKLDTVYRGSPAVTTNLSPLFFGSMDFFLTHVLSYFYETSMFNCGNLTIKSHNSLRTITYYTLYLIFQSISPDVSPPSMHESF